MGRDSLERQQRGPGQADPGRLVEGGLQPGLGGLMKRLEASTAYSSTFASTII
jgi:hypothetical protein